MNISKLKLAWKFLTGGGTGVIDYVLDVANTFADRLADAKKDDISKWITTARRILDTLNAISWLCPKKWTAAYGLTLSAFSDLVDALYDIKFEKEELAKVADAFRIAYAAWRAE